MNIRSAELLNQSLQNAADNIYRNRALAASMQEEMARNSIEQSFRNAMMQHYAQMEGRQQEFYNRQQGAQSARELLDSQNIAREQQQNVLAQKQKTLQTIMGLNSTGQLSPDGLKRANQWLASDPDLGKTGIQLQVPANPSTNPAHIQDALAQKFALRDQMQTTYNAEKDPAQKAALGKDLDDFDAFFLGKRASGKDGMPESGPGSITPAQEKADEAADDAIDGANSPAVMPSGLNLPGFASGGKIAATAEPMASLTQADLTPVTRMAPAAPGAAGTLTGAMPLAPGLGNAAVNANGIPTGRLIKDNSGNMWHYTGTAADPKTDINPNNWNQVPQAQ